MLAPNAWDEDKGMLKRWVRKEKMNQRVLLDAGSVFESYGGSSVPTVLWIDREGVVFDALVGETGMADLEKRTKKLLKAD